MKIVIIEDERITAKDLEQTLKEIDPDIEIVAVIRSVKEGLAYFSHQPSPALIFSDIRLGDGLSFEILKLVKVPVIFCTAYDEYALYAFQVNGIGYVLKPFTEESVAAALTKYNELTRANETEIGRQYEKMKDIFDTVKPKISSLLIHYKDTVIPIRISDIALFCLKNEVLTLYTFDHKRYYPNMSLDELEELLGDLFFRANRQYLVARSAIVHASSLLSRKMSIHVSIRHDDIITISREKSPQFLKWLQASPV